MSAQQISVITAVFSSHPGGRIPYGQFEQADERTSFTFTKLENIRTLSTNTAQDSNPITGLLYVPDLETDDCVRATAAYVPQNATRRSNLPNADFDLVAFAPWISPQCTLEYLSSASGDGYVRAMIVYIPSNGTDIPPTVNDQVWGLGDGGSWKSKNKYPVYALPGMSGSIIMDNLAQYSGNMTDVEYGHELSAHFDSSDYVRLWTAINTASRSNLPSLWVFLLIVLGLLILIISATSCVMHCIQKKRRHQLRRRVENGEIDLEALGIKRLTVPQEVLNTFPTFVYNDESSARPALLAPPTAAHLPAALPRRNSDPTGRDPGPPSSLAGSLPTTESYALYSQTTCPICLDDFVPRETIVRSLPCHHIFHPECIDSFLRGNSSLCPMCKKTTLPKGYCPASVTNAMVRRERMVRRMRSHATESPAGSGGQHWQSRLSFQDASRRLSMAGLRNAVAGRRISSAPVQLPSYEMRDNSGSHPVTSATASTANVSVAPVQNTLPAACPPSPTVERQHQSRREWARRRALALLGERRTRQEEEVDQEIVREAEGRSGWRKAVHRVFPGF